MSINFPGTLDTETTLFHPFNRYKWTSFLKTSISDSDTLLVLSDTSDIPAQLAGNYIGINDEIMFVSSIDNTGAEKKITVIRAQGDSVAAEHSLNTEVVQCHTAELHNKLVEAIIAIETAVLNATPTPITVSINADPKTYTFTGFKGYNYILKIAVKSADSLKKQVKSFIINQWNDAVNIPQWIEGMLFEIGTGIDIQVSNFQANVETFDIVVTGANGGEMLITVHEKGAIQ